MEVIRRTNTGLRTHGLTRTRSAIFSSRSPFFSDPASDRFDTDSELSRVRFVLGLVLDTFLVLVEGVGTGGAAAVAGGVGDGVGDGGAVVVPLASSSVRESFDGRVKMPFSGSD